MRTHLPFCCTRLGIVIASSRLGTAFVLASLAMAACAAEVDGLGEAASEKALPIAGGELAPEETAVVGFLTGHGSCSGTLIAQNLVLTAHHCVADTPPGPVDCGSTTFGAINLAGMSITTRDTVFGTVRHFVREVHVPPDATDVCGGDIAVMLLDDMVDPQDAWAIPPRIDEEPHAEEVYRAVGFGATDGAGNGSGFRRQRTGLLVNCFGAACPAYFQVQDNEWMGETGVCSGDSGGPALDEAGRVFGVTSRGGEECTTPIYSSVSGWSSWLKEMGLMAAEAGGYEPAPWVVGGSTLPTPRPEPEPDAGVDGDGRAPSGDASGADGGCSLGRTGQPIGAAWLVLVATIAIVVRRKRGWHGGAIPPRAWGWTALLVSAIAPGCRCSGPSEDLLPKNSPSPAMSTDSLSQGQCPPRPAWAGKLDDSVEVELLHASEKKKGEAHGTGYRLLRDGRFETYDDVLLEPNDEGKLVFKRVEGKWSTRGFLQQSAREALAKRAGEVPAERLDGRWRTEGASFVQTHLALRRGDAIHASCYFGQDAPKALADLEKKIHDLVNQVVVGDGG